MKTRRDPLTPEWNFWFRGWFFGLKLTYLQVILFALIYGRTIQERGRWMEWTQEDLVAYLHCSGTAVHTNLKALVEAGFVEKVEYYEDRSPRCKYRIAKDIIMAHEEDLRNPDAIRNFYSEPGTMADTTKNEVCDTAKGVACDASFNLGCGVGTPIYKNINNNNSKEHAAACSPAPVTAHIDNQVSGEGKNKRARENTSPVEKALTLRETVAWLEAWQVTHDHAAEWAVVRRSNGKKNTPGVMRDLAALFNEVKAKGYTPDDVIAAAVDAKGKAQWINVPKAEYVMNYYASRRLSVSSQAKADSAAEHGKLTSLERIKAKDKKYYAED